jgi:hypothetical protein
MNISGTLDTSYNIGTTGFSGSTAVNDYYSYLNFNYNPQTLDILDNDFEDLYPWWVQNREGQIIRRVNIDFTFFECGIHALKDVINLPQSFYEDMNIPFEIHVSKVNPEGVKII